MTSRAIGRIPYQRGKSTRRPLMFLASFGRACTLLLAVPGAASASAATLERGPDGIVVPVAGGVLKIEVCADDIVRVAHATDRAFFTRPSLATAPKRCAPAPWKLDERP